MFRYGLSLTNQNNTQTASTPTITIPSDTYTHGQTVYWSVRASNLSGSTAWSSNRSFTVDTQEPVAKNKGLYIKSELELNLPNIRFDTDKISQVLNNLIDNAIKFTERGGIVISSKNPMDANYVLVSIKDTGQGISQDEIPKLFQKFQQLGDPTMRKVGGTGLGLSICSEIINQHRGKIWIESQVGRGSRIQFILPIEERRNRSL